MQHDRSESAASDSAVAPPTAETTTPRLRLTAALAIVAAALLLHGPSLRGYFLAEDFGYLAEAHRALQHDPWHLLSQFYTPIPEDHAARFFRPLPRLVLALDHLAFGSDATGYHATNLALFAITCVLLLRLLLRVTGSAWLAFVATLLFTAFPTHPEAVTWITGREELLPLLFLILACNLVTAKDVRVVRRGVPVAILLGLLSKEWVVPSIVLPIAVRALVIAGDSPLQRFRRAARDTVWVWPVLAGYLLLRSHVVGSMVEGYRGLAPFPVTEGAFWEQRMRFFTTLLVPVRDSALPDGIEVLLGLALVAGIVVAARRRHRLAPALRRAWTLSIAWIAIGFIAHVPARFDFDLFRDVRHLYSAVPGYALLLAIAGHALLPRSRLVRAGAVVGAVTLLALALEHSRRPWLQASAFSRHLVTEVRASASRDDRSLRIVGIPSIWRGAHLGIGAGAITQPPFAPPGSASVQVVPDLFVIGHRGFEKAAPFFAAWAHLRNADPGVQMLLCEADPLRLVPVPDPRADVVVRGRLTRPSALDGTSRLGCTDLRVSLAPGVANPPPGVLLELRGAPAPHAARSRPHLVARSARVVEPIIDLRRSADDPDVLVIGIVHRPGAGVVLMLDPHSDVLPFRGRGTFLTGAATPALVAVLDRHGTHTARLDVPADRLEEPVRVQAALFDEDGTVTLSECACLR